MEKRKRERKVEGGSYLILGEDAGLGIEKLVVRVGSQANENKSLKCPRQVS